MNRSKFNRMVAKYDGQIMSRKELFKFGISYYYYLTMMFRGN